MFTVTRSFAFVVLAATLATAQADSGTPLQLKGVKIGDTPEVACPGSPVTKTWQENAAALLKHGIKAKDLDVTECDPVISRTADIAASEPAHILFMDGRVIFYRFNIEGVPLEKQWDILVSLKTEFGPWKVRHKREFSHFKWSRKGQELEVERVARGPNGDEMSFFLRDTAKMGVYQAETDRVTRILEGQISRDRGRSVLEKD